MTTKLIALVIIVAALYGGWNLFLYYDRIKHDEDLAAKQAAAALNVSPESLPGLPWQLENGLKAAQNAGPRALEQWLKANDKLVADPRKAWIELDYCVMIARDEPAEARRVFARVKDRVPPSSPLWPRINQLAKTYQ